MPFLETYDAETPLRRVCNIKQMTRIVNVLMDLEGIGITVQRDYSREGRGWKLVIEPASIKMMPDGTADNDLLIWDDSAKSWSVVTPADYDADQVQLLGHDASGDWKWYNTCPPISE